VRPARTQQLFEILGARRVLRRNQPDPKWKRRQTPLAPFIDVLVTGTVTKNGRLISGDTTAVVAVATEPGYAPDPGHAGTGTVVSVVCRAGGNPGGEEGGAG